MTRSRSLGKVRPPRSARHPYRGRSTGLEHCSTEASTTVPQPTGGVLRLADYLEQHGRSTRRGQCPPATFWHAAHTHLTHPDDLNNLTQAALDRHRLQCGHHLLQRASDLGDTDALYRLAVMRERAGDRDGAEAFYRQAADHGHTYALYHLAVMREEAGDREGAEDLARQAADHGDTHALVHLAEMREHAGDRDGAEDLARQAADLGHTDALVRLAVMREVAGDRDGAEGLHQQAANYGEARRVIAELWPYGLDPDGTPTSPLQPSLSVEGR
ncbi:tetratricopeptide repeat protein [Streptomyces sp. NPDC000878]